MFESITVNNVKGGWPSSRKKLNSLFERQIVCRITVNNVKAANQRAINRDFLLISLSCSKDNLFAVLIVAFSLQIVMSVFSLLMADSWCFWFSVSSFFSLMMMAWFLLFSLMAVFASLSVNDLRDTGKREVFLQWLSHFSVDFVSLEETHVVTPQECQSWFSAKGFSSLASVGSAYSCGSILLYKPTCTFVRSWSDDEGRFIMGEFLFHGVTFRVVCLYASNGNPEREEFYELLTVSGAHNYGLLPY